MGILDSVGVKTDFFGNFNFSALGSWAIVLVVFFIFLLLSGVITFFYYFNKSKKNQFKYKIPIFVKINEKYSRVDIDNAKEVLIPDTNIGLFYLQKRRIYIARPTRSMGKDEFWYAISENGEWVNFDLSTDPEHNTLAIANYDHRDTRYAYVNLKDIIKRNYKDKTVKWWKEYAGVISIVIISIMFIGAMWFFFWQVGNLIKERSPIASNMKDAAEGMKLALQNAQNINSGVIQG